MANKVEVLLRENLKNLGKCGEVVRVAFALDCHDREVISWVATTAHLPRAAACSRICFCSTGTRSNGSSTPRSPRATITPSATRKIVSRFSIASGFSSFAIIGVSFPARRTKRFASATSSGRRTKLTAM